MKFFPIGCDVNEHIVESPLAGRTLALLVASNFKHESIKSIDDFKNVSITSMTNLSGNTVFLGGYIITQAGNRLNLEFGHLQFTAEDIRSLNSAKYKAEEFLVDANEMLRGMPNFIAALKDVFAKAKK